TMQNELAGYAQTWMNEFSLLRQYNESAVAWMFVFYIHFGDQLLDISKQSKLLRQVLSCTVILLILYGLFHLVCQSFGLWLSIAEGSYVYFRLFFIPVYIFILALIILKVKNPLKPFLLIANFCLLTGVIASV